METENEETQKKPSKNDNDSMQLTIRKKMLATFRIYGNTSDAKHANTLHCCPAVASSLAGCCSRPWPGTVRCDTQGSVAMPAVWSQNRTCGG